VAWYFVLHFNMVAKPGHKLVTGLDLYHSQLLGDFSHSGNFHIDSVLKETWSNFHVVNFMYFFNFLHDDWAPSQTPVLSVTR
jgi:hypothetical protein